MPEGFHGLQLFGLGRSWKPEKGSGDHSPPTRRARNILLEVSERSIWELYEVEEKPSDEAH